MKLSFENKHAIVCGGTDGIGKSTAELLAASAEKSATIDKFDT